MSSLLRQSLMTVLLLTIGITLCVLMLRLIGLKLQETLNYHFGNNTFSRWLLMPGTVIHELSHYLLVKLFGLHATEVKLFIPDVNSETLGFVDYSYNLHSVLNKFGLTFVGVAPLFGISGVLFFVYDKMFSTNLHHIFSMTEQAINNSDLSQLFNTFKYIFNPFNYSFGKLVLFMIICVFLLSGFSLSMADLQTSLKGLPYFILFMFCLVVIAQLVPTFNVLCIRFVLVSMFVIILLSIMSLLVLLILNIF